MNDLSETRRALPARTALITGASRGLGRALALELARRGWRLVLTARGDEALRRTGEVASAFGPVTVVRGDVTDPVHRQELAREVKNLGGVDLVVNNASDLGPTPLPPLLDYPLASLEDLFRTNTVAPLALLQALRPSLGEGACIINVTSDAGVEAYSGWGGYGASKAALEQLSAVLAAENPTWRTYWIDPGDMRTDMQQAAFPGEDIGDRPLPEASVPAFITLIEGSAPSGRYLARTIARERLATHA
jgi:NAD(P)-dependent dehydrogenase (short-subunit alcohol dehydrogenase family)